MRTIVVLGGTGWLGRHVCAAFRRRGDRVVVIARTPAAYLPDCRFVQLDLAGADAATLERLLRAERADVVVNATDGANATDGWEHPESRFRAINVEVVDRLLDAMATLPHRPVLVHLGTVHEYGPVPAGTLINENTSPRPVGAYSRTKLAGSQVVQRARRTGRVDGTVVRLANVSGPHPSPLTFPGKLVRDLRAAMAASEPLRVRVADAKRDYFDVRDAAAAIVKASEARPACEVVNIGSGVAVSMRELAETFVAAAGCPAATIDADESAGPSLGGTWWTQVDIRLAAEVLGWVPTIPLAESMRSMWESAS